MEEKAKARGGAAEAERRKQDLLESLNQEKIRLEKDLVVIRR
jgi:hypothetical protein